MIGAPREKIIGSICHKYICPAEKGKCPITDLGQKVDNSERVLLKANGGSIPILKTVVPVTLKGIRYLLETIVDITEYKKIEEELKKAKDNLQAKVEELEKFNKIAIGRELKMIELKKKITELEGLLRGHEIKLEEKLKKKLE
jgi:hypothetical protein